MTKAKPQSYGRFTDYYAHYIKDGKEISDVEIDKIETVIIAASRDLDPHTVEELQVALDLRQQLTIAEAERRGYTTKTRRRSRNLNSDPAKFQWKTYTEQWLVEHKMES